MKLFIRWLSIESFKLIHSSLILIHILVPLTGIAAFLAYYSVSFWNEEQKVSAYVQVLALIFPAIIGVVSSISWEHEARAGSFQMILSCPCPKYIPHLAKSCVLLFWGLASSIIAVCGFGMAFRLLGYTGFTTLFYWKASILLFVGNIPLYFIHTLISFSLGKGPCLGAGIGGSLVSALLVTGLGSKIWPFLPWGISIRFVSLLASGTRPPAAQIQNIKTAGCFIAGSSLLLLLLTIYLSKRWEGRKCNEETG